jgi:hypothetical protein
MVIFGSMTTRRVPTMQRPLPALRAMLIAVFAVAASVSSALAEPLITSDVTPRFGQTDDLFIFTVKLSGFKTSNVRPRLLNDVDFEASLLGPQTSISIINGVVDTRVNYVYQLAAKRSGTLKTPTVEVQVDGKTLTAPSITVEVQDVSSDPNDTSLDHNNGPTKPTQLFLKQTATPLKAYVGQQIIDALSLYTQVELAEYHLEDFSADGFWQERLIDNDRSVTELNGQQYTRVEHAKALYPLAAGSIELPARKVVAKVPVRTKHNVPSLFQMGEDLLGQLFQTIELRNVTLSSNSLSVDVQQLPPAPPELNPLLGSVPLVGTTSLRTSYSADPISAGEMKTVTLELITEGNVRPFHNISLPTPEGVKVYDQKPETTTVTSSGRVVMKRTFRFSIVPLKGGIVRIPPVRIAYFDPTKHEYLTSTSAEISFAVNGAVLSSAPEAASTPSAQHDPSGPETKGVPTLPPVPVAPDLEYREPSIARRLGEAVSVQLALLLLTVTIALSTVAIVLLRLRQGGKHLTVTPRRIDRADSLADLESLVRTAIVERVPGSTVDDSFETLRARTQARVDRTEVAQALCALIDELEILRYGTPPSETTALLLALKSRFKEILQQWKL